MSSIPFGKYQIRRELGRGAMGIVYEAHDAERGLDVALKVMTATPQSSKDARQRQLTRFYREARVMTLLDHPRIVRFYEQGMIAGRHYFAMELVSGTNMRERLQFQGALSLPELVRLGVELCEALDHLQRRGVVHRDVKPDNVMLLPDGSCKLMDFGVAQIVGDVDGEGGGGFHGSPAYMSPEQVSSRVVDGRSDIYSLAVTLYEAATGRRAVQGESIPAITQKILNEYPPAPVGLPPYFQAILLRALTKDPVFRYQSAQAMADDLRAQRMPAPLSALSAQPAGPAPSAPPHPYLGTTSAPASVVAVSDVEMTQLDSNFILPGATPVEERLPRVACYRHQTVAGILRCTECGQTICYTCMLELAGRGVICRGCAFPAY